MDQLLNQLETKLSNKDFFNLVKNWVTYNEQHAKTNKENYFSCNQKLIQIKAISTGADKAEEIMKKVLPVNGMAAITAIAAYCLAVFPTADQVKWGLTVVLAVLWVAALAVAGFRHFETKRLKLRRYGQTWVRHRITAEKYRQEIILFLYDVAVYRQAATSQEKEKLFMERILSIYEDNMNRFADNMKTLDEYID
ncbi:MAG: hypothetical protein Q4C66_04195 [Lachnospiraceae bacterium]|nr:hypothetical protein [Lachnospiraceae bacterium]